jgi:hypothetical protein
MAAKTPNIRLTATQEFWDWFQAERKKRNMTEGEFLAFLITEKAAKEGFEGSVMNRRGSYERDWKETEKVWNILKKGTEFDDGDDV